MTGPEHYRAAEIALDAAAATQSEDLRYTATEALLDAVAHATLALAAATAEAFTPVDRSDRSWIPVIRP